MGKIRRLVLDTLKPHEPSIVEWAGILSELEGISAVNISIYEMDRKVENAKIFKSIPMLDEAARTAAMRCTFKPAKQRDKFVKVKMNIPFKFKLK